MRTVRFVPFALILATVYCAAEPPAALSGRVLDPSASIVPDAIVQLTSRDAQIQRIARVSESGEYRFSAVPPGDYLLTALSTGFAASNAIEVQIRSGAETVRDIALEMARVSSQVQVTATATAQSADEQAKALDIVGGGALAARADYAVVEAIRTLPGIRVQQLGGPGALARIHARGLRPFDTSLVIDGARFRDAASPQGEASAFLGDLMLVNSEQIEVLRGSGSSLYGTNAEGGVVNVVTSPGSGRVHGDVAVDGGGLGLARGVARLGGSTPGDRLRYSAGLAHLNVMHGVDGNDRYRNTTAQGSGGYSLTPALNLTARVFAADAFAQLNQNPFVPSAVSLPGSGLVQAEPVVNYTPALDDPDSSRTSRFVSTLIALNHHPRSNASWTVRYHLLTTDRDNRDGPAGTFFPPQWNNSNFFGGRIDTLEARADVRLGRIQYVTAGYEWEREAFDNHSTDANPAALLRTDARLKIAQRSGSVFVQDQISLLSDRLQISLSGRTQGFQLDRPQFSGGSALYIGVPLRNPPRAWTGDLSLAWYVSASGTKFRTHVGNGYRAPSLYERFGASFFFGSFSAYGDPRLAPERLISVDGGVDQYLFRSKLRVSGTYFYTPLQQVIAFDFSGAISPATDPFGRFGGYVNGKGGLSRGVELSMEARPTSTLAMTAGYTFTNADDRRSLYAGGELGSINVSHHMVTANVIQRVGRRVELAFAMFTGSDYLFPLFVGFESRAFQFGGPVKADITASYSLPLSDVRSVRLFTRVENVFNRTYYEDGFRTPKAWAVAGLKFGF